MTCPVGEDVSVLWATAPAESRKRIEKALWNSVEDVVSKLQVNLKWLQGVEQEGRHSRFLLSAFQQRMDHSGRPDLRVECLLFNLNFHADGTSTKIPADLVKKGVEQLQAVYAQTIKEWMFAKTSLAIETDRNQFKLAGIPKQAVASLKGDLAQATQLSFKDIKQKRSPFGVWEKVGRDAGFGRREVKHLLKYHQEQQYSKAEAR